MDGAVTTDATFPGHDTSLITSDGINTIKGDMTSGPIIQAQETGMVPYKADIITGASNQQSRHAHENIKQEPISDSELSDALASSDEWTDDEETGDQTQPPSKTLKLRPYQLELAQTALQGKNTIVCAETGTGKTWVALYVIGEHLQNKQTHETRRVAFMAKTNLLVTQQTKRLTTLLKMFSTKLLEGEKEENRLMAAFLKDFDILCFTPQVLLNNLKQGTVKLSDYTLWVLDECHNTKGDAPYASLMRHYLVEQENGAHGLPQILGLTASIGVGKSKTTEQAVEHILNVCALLDTTTISTVEKNREEFKKHIVTPEEYKLAMKVRGSDPGRDTLLQVMEDIGEMLDDLIVMIYDLTEINQQRPRDKESRAYYKWTYDMKMEAASKLRDTEKTRDIISCIQHLNIYHSALEINRLLQIQSVTRFLAQKHSVSSDNPDVLTKTECELQKKLKDTLLKLTKEARQDGSGNENVKLISDQLKQAIEKEGTNSRALVFVETRATCRAIADFLNADLRVSGIRISPLVGKDEKGGDKGMREEEQAEVLKQFTDGYYMVLVCTSVGTEGIDVPDCNIIINYNYNGNEITKIQMKGISMGKQLPNINVFQNVQEKRRTRKKGGRHVTIGTDEQMDRDRINVFKVNMMYNGLAEFKKLKPGDKERRMRAFQKEEIQKQKSKVAIKSFDGACQLAADCTILCGKCSTLVCKLSDVRMNGTDRFVADRSFHTRYNKKTHKKPATYDGKTKAGKMYCANCNYAWGVINVVRDIPIGVLRIRNLKLLNSASNGIEQYERWDKVSYAIPDMSTNEIEAFFKADPQTSMS